MKFNKVLIKSILKEWRYYSVDYKAMKKTLKNSNPNQSENCVGNKEFFRLYDDAKDRVAKFYEDREEWAISYSSKLEELVITLSESKVSTSYSCFERDADLVTESSLSGAASLESDSESDEDNEMHGIDSMSKESRIDMSIEQTNKCTINFDALKEEYRRVGKSEHFHSYIYAKKSLATFSRELDLLLEFLELNRTAFSKILKKFDKRTGSAIREMKLMELEKTHAFLNGTKLKQLKARVTQLLKKTVEMKPPLPKGWAGRKVYTIGCFDLFHRGHQNVLVALREFGYYIVAGIHDDESYFKLKNKYTIDNLETRMENAKPFVDQLFVIPSTKPDLYLKSMVSEQDILSGSCCYARGDDMLQFPGREWVESVMPVHFVPRTESCSSSLLRTIYHSEDPELAKKAAYAVTRYDGKPVDENGNVLKT